MAGLSLLPNLGLGGLMGSTGTVGTTTSQPTPGSQAQNISKATVKTTKVINDLVTRIATAKEKAATASQAELPQLQRAIVTLQSQLQALAKSEAEETPMKKRHKNINNITTKKNMKESSKQVQEGMFSGAAKGAAKGAVLGGLGGAALGALGGPLGMVAGGISGAAKGAGMGGIVGGVTDEDGEDRKKSKKKKFKPKAKTEAKVVAKEGVTRTLGKAAGTVGGAYGGGTLGAGIGSTAGGVAGGTLGALAGLPLGPAGVAGGAALGSSLGAGAGALGGAVGGGLLGGKLGHDIGDFAGRKIEGENEENLERLTDIQDKVVNALAKRKYYVNRVSYQFAEQEGGPTVFMTMKPNHYTSRYAEVDPNGLVNGESLEEFLGGREENEEKMLSAKQQRIARLAGDPNKIDSADFAKLRAMKENVELPSFLRAILQKNYAEADKYLGSVINEKLKKLINTALDKNL